MKDQNKTKEPVAQYIGGDSSIKQSIKDAVVESDIARLAVSLAVFYRKKGINADAGYLTDQINTMFFRFPEDYKLQFKIVESDIMSPQFVMDICSSEFKEEWASPKLCELITLAGRKKNISLTKWVDAINESLKIQKQTSFYRFMRTKHPLFVSSLEDEAKFIFKNMQTCMRISMIDEIVYINRRIMEFMIKSIRKCDATFKRTSGTPSKLQRDIYKGYEFIKNGGEIGPQQ